MIQESWELNPNYAAKMKQFYASPNYNGMGCSLYYQGMCMARAVGQNDASVGPEPCSMHNAGYTKCELYQVFGHRA